VTKFMYFKYNEQKYEYAGTTTDKDTGLTLELNTGEVLEVTSWAPSKPVPKPLAFKSVSNTNESTRLAKADRVSYSLVAENEFTKIRSPKTVISIIRKFKKVPFKVKLVFDRDVLAHTDGALRQELIFALVTDDWGKFKILDYALIGFEKPNMVHFEGHIGFNTKVR